MQLSYGERMHLLEIASQSGADPDSLIPVARQLEAYVLGLGPQGAASNTGVVWSAGADTTKQN